MKRIHYAVAAAVLAVVAGVFLVFRTGAAQAQPDTRDSEEYRVELVQNDQYMVQKGLNSMARQGFYYVSSIHRNDGKVLLVFRKYAR
jgi:CTP:molybdopterin cytidylyltransferase MocA